MAEYDWRSIAQLFNQALLKRLAQNQGLDAITRAARFSPLSQVYRKASLGHLLDQLHDLLSIHYRAEYIYKNAVAKKISLERHISQQSRLITEFRVNQSKADTVILNGTSTVYEIKTELDDLKKLPGQLEDYKKVFDKIYVATHSKGASKVLEAVPDHVGIIVMNEAVELDVVREAASNVEQVEPLVIFDALRKSEYLSILSEKYDFIPPANQFDIYHAAREQFRRLTPKEAHDGMLVALKSRTRHLNFVEFVKKLPHSLRAIGLASELSHKCQNEIVNRLSKPI